MIGKSKLGFFIIVAAIIALCILFAQNRKQTFYNGTFVIAGGHVGYIYQASEEIIDRQA